MQPKELNIKLLPASPALMPVIQNMARFYAYDLSKSCGHDGVYDWSFPDDGLYEALDVSKYWQPNAYPFVIYADEELAGFALINKIGTSSDVDWNMGEFFIVGKFQGMGVGRQIAFQIFDQFSGTWEVMQMLRNKPAIKFWEKVISEYTQEDFAKEIKSFQEPKPHENIILKFNRSTK